MKILIQNGRVIDPARGFDQVCDVALATGRVVAIGQAPAGFEADRVIDASGQWVAEVGVPAKSGVSGALLGAVPGALGIATWSPRLDEQGNSRRGIGLFEGLSSRWDLHVLQHRGALRGLSGPR